MGREAGVCVSDARCQCLPPSGAGGATTSGLRRLSALLPKDTAITRDIALAACAPAGFVRDAAGRLGEMSIAYRDAARAKKD